MPDGVHGNKLYCSPECKKKAVTRNTRNTYRRNPNRAQNNNAIRRAMILERSTENVRREAVFDRDGWECHICGGGIDRAAKWPDPLSVTLDHVIPLAKGGDHSYGNCKAAHWGCNLKKSDTL